MKAGTSHLVSVHDVVLHFFILTRLGHIYLGCSRRDSYSLGFPTCCGAVLWPCPVPVLVHDSHSTMRAPTGTSGWGQRSSPQPTDRTPSAITHTRAAVAGEALSVCTHTHGFHQETSIKNVHSEWTNVLRSHEAGASMKLMGKKWLCPFSLSKNHDTLWRWEQQRRGERCSAYMRSHFFCQSDFPEDNQPYSIP